MSENQIDLITTMSPSRLGCAQQCLAKFAFRYVDKLRGATSAALQFGRAFDEAGAAVYAAKMTTGTTLPSSDVQARFAAEWDFAAGAVDDWGEDSRGGLLDSGTRGVALWRDRIAQHVQPVAVQEDLRATVVDPATGEPFQLRGVIDVRGSTISNPAVVADIKTSARVYQPARFAREWQPAAYTLLAGTPTFEYHVVTSAKAPETQVLRAVVSDGDRTAFLRRAAMLRRQIAHAARTGDWLPNRTHVLCSRRYCEHWAACEQRYGGRVPA